LTLPDFVASNGIVSVETRGHIAVDNVMEISASGPIVVCTSVFSGDKRDRGIDFNSAGTAYLEAIENGRIKIHTPDQDRVFVDGCAALTEFHFPDGSRFEALINIISVDRHPNRQTILAAFQNSDIEVKFWRGFHANMRRGPAPGEANDWPKLPERGQYTESSRQRRLNFLSEHTGVSLSKIGKTEIQSENLKGITEHAFGSIEVPVGAAGPLLFHGQHTRGHMFAPMATTEGSLIASATRGATAITCCGGVTTAVLDRRITRVPAFQMANLPDALFLARWIENHFSEIQQQTRLMSRHAALKAIQPHILGRDLHVHFVYDSGDAAGQNMTTGCTWRACHWIMDQIQAEHDIRVEHFIIESNLSSDKKVTFNNFMYGRGTRAVAECKLTGQVTKRMLHVTPQQLVRGYHSLAAGGVATGMVGVNINIANMVAAIFTSTGQDIASTHESGVGHLTLDLVDNGEAVYASLMMPSLLIGTVGGGTRLPQQREALQMIGCDGSEKSPRLAEIVCGFALALDLSTLSALVADEFAAAHHPLVKGSRKK
jgi:hydroxymethylglutaryl-CoA reductase (NADPH)